MAIVLKSKPGLSSTTTLNIPKDWDPTWFRNLISNQLKGADVRNAIGANGISITGNIASPYATISLGPGPIVINTPAGTVALTINGATGQDALDVKVAGTLIFSVAAGGIFANTWSSISGIQTITASSGLQITGGPISGKGPIAGVQVDLTPDTGTFTGSITGCTTAVNIACKWTRIGNLVILVLNNTNASATGTSNSTSMTITGIPAAIQPAGTQATKIAFMEDNTAGTDGAGNLSGGTITLFKGASQSGASWTAAGTKGMANANTFAYILN